MFKDDSPEVNYESQYAYKAYETRFDEDILADMRKFKWFIKNKYIFKNEWIPMLIFWLSDGLIII